MQPQLVLVLQCGELPSTLLLGPCVVELIFKYMPQFALVQHDLPTSNLFKKMIAMAPANAKQRRLYSKVRIP